jgi:hypothetical protein
MKDKIMSAFFILTVSLRILIYITFILIFTIPILAMIGITISFTVIAFSAGIIYFGYAILCLILTIIQYFLCITFIKIALKGIDIEYAFLTYQPNT